MVAVFEALAACKCCASNVVFSEALDTCFVLRIIQDLARIVHHSKLAEQKLHAKAWQIRNELSHSTFRFFYMKGCWTCEGVHFHPAVLLLAWFDSIQLKLDRPLKGSQIGFAGAITCNKCGWCIQIPLLGVIQKIVCAQYDILWSYCFSSEGTWRSSSCS